VYSWGVTKKEMREIIFRAWDYTHWKMMNGNIWVQAHWPINIWVEFTDFEEWHFVTYPLPNHELMQYTWLKDKNGTMIFEWDILADEKDYKSGNYMAFEVFYHDWDCSHGVGFKLNRTHCHWSRAWWCIPVFVPKEVKKLKVIWNIYENTELLINPL